MRAGVLHVQGMLVLPVEHQGEFLVREGCPVGHLVEFLALACVRCRTG